MTLIFTASYQISSVTSSSCLRRFHKTKSTVQSIPTVDSKNQRKTFKLTENADDDKVKDGAFNSKFLPRRKHLYVQVKLELECYWKKHRLSVLTVLAIISKLTMNIYLNFFGGFPTETLQQIHCNSFHGFTLSGDSSFSMMQLLLINS